VREAKKKKAKIPRSKKQTCHPGRSEGPAFLFLYLEPKTDN